MASTTRHLFIQASNIHRGGGSILLAELLHSIIGTLPVTVLSDIRLKPNLPVARTLTFFWIRNTLLHRLFAELWLACHVTTGDTLLCFGNLPPILRSRGRTILFLQNRLLLECSPISESTLSFQAFRIQAEKLWFRIFHSNVDKFIVQTPSMHQLLINQYPHLRDVQILPFASSAFTNLVKTTRKPTNKISKYDFLYVSSGEPHKNHKNLVRAWVLLANEGIYPSLCLTLDPASSLRLISWIDVYIKDHSLRIRYHHNVSNRDMPSLYLQSFALIYPSLLESYGLPLIEASRVGIPILASELDYVRDVAQPVETFDPLSPVSIARAVKRFLDIDCISPSVITSSQFISSIL